MQDELDENLRSLFEEQSSNLPEEPFLSNVLKIIQRKRSRRIFMRQVAYVLGIVCCFFLSPFLVNGSLLLSSALDALLRAFNSFLDTPAAMLAAALGALLFLFFRRRQISRFA